ncbi:MAG: hypothetical protein WDA07_06445 [Leucobacter sp.]
MAYTLRSSPLTAKLVSCLVVDEDGNSVIDLCGNTIAVHANVTFDSSTWKGVSRRYFQTTGSGSYVAQGVTWPSPRPVLPNKSIGAVFVAMAGLGPGSSYRRLVSISSPSNGISYNSTTDLLWFGANISGGYAPPYNTTPTPDDWSVKFSFAGNYHELNKHQLFYGLESDANIALEADSDTTHNYAFGSTPSLYSVGGYDGQGWQSGRFHCVCIFGQLITQAEAQALHEDWFNTLIDTGADPDPDPASIIITPSPIIVVAGAAELATITRDQPAPAGGVTYNLLSDNPNVATVPASVFMDEAETTAEFSVTGVTEGATTIDVENADDPDEAGEVGVTVNAPPLGVIKGFRVQLGDGTTAAANLTNVALYWWDATKPAGAPVFETHTAATDANGWIEANVNDSTSLNVGDYGYAIAVKLGANPEDDFIAGGRVAIEDLAG